MLLRAACTIALFSLCLVTTCCSPGTGEANSTDTESGEPTPPIPTSPLGEKTILGQAFGCTDKAALEKLVKIAAENDSEAFSRGLEAGLLTGECATFSAGDDVFVRDTDISTLAGISLVRRKGETVEYWIVSQAVN